MLWMCSLRERGSSRTNTENIGQENQLLNLTAYQTKVNFNQEIKRDILQYE